MENKLHILHVVGGMDVGGIENMLITFMPYMKEKGIIFDFVVHGNDVGIHEAYIMKLGGSVYHLSRFKIGNILIYLNEWISLIKTHPELVVVHGHMTSTACVYLFVAKWYGRIAIAHSHNTGHRGGWLSKKVKTIMEYPLRYICDYFFACSKAAAEFHFGSKITKNHRYKSWRNGIDTEKFYFSKEDRRKYRNKMGLNDEVLIGHVGRMTFSKNHSFILKIFREYHAMNPNSKLLLIGDGEMRCDIENEIEAMDLRENVILMGCVNNPEKFLSAMDVFLLPSRWEGLGVSVIEAQINGLNCLVSDCVQPECIISNNVYMLSLNDAPSVWCNKLSVIQHRNMDRIHNPYDAKELSESVYAFYKEAVNK